MFALCDFRNNQTAKHRKRYKVSTEKVELVRRAERGGRVEDIRKSADLTGEGLAAEMNRLAQAHEGFGALSGRSQDVTFPPASSRRRRGHRAGSTSYDY
jgi:hypothetical protein